jgi:hypothetical protein
MELSQAERQEAVEAMLKHDFPYNLLFWTNFFGILLALIVFALQIVSIIFQSPYYYFGAG